MLLPLNEQATLASERRGNVDGGNGRVSCGTLDRRGFYGFGYKVNKPREIPRRILHEGKGHDGWDGRKKALCVREGGGVLPRKKSTGQCGNQAWAPESRLESSIACPQVNCGRCAQKGRP